MATVEEVSAPKRAIILIKLIEISREDTCSLIFRNLTLNTLRSLNLLCSWKVRTAT